MKRATSLIEWRSDDDEVRDREVFPRMVLAAPAGTTVSLLSVESSKVSHKHTVSRHTFVGEETGERRGSFA